MVFRTPTVLKSTDRQCGQRVENTAYSNLSRWLLIRLTR